MDAILSKSTNKHKQFDVIINGKKAITFGDAKYSDYTINKDPKRKENYINRHKKNETWNLTCVETKGFWGKNVLWNQSTFENSVDDINKRFKNLNVKMK